jgi:23S rRNA (adenine2503-C2)-methyltransferase
MSTELQKTNLLDLDEKGLLAFFVEWGEKPFRARQVLKWIHKFGISDFDAMTDLSKVLRARLALECELKGPEISEELVSKDGTRKWLMRIEGGSLIETVYIPEETRGTLCVSSQVGCALNCTFCSTATQGFNRNLSVAEIIGQVRLAQQRLRALSVEAAEDTFEFFEITNIVMMGMGEPLLNYDNVIKAMALMRHDDAYGLPRRRVTLSTSGVVPNIERLEQDADVSLALSLHAPNDALRNILVPINKKYPIEVLLNACKRYVSKNRRYKITIEYVLLRGVNDTAALAKQLAALLKQLPCKINLIPFNPFPGADYERSYPEDILAFKDILVNAGYVVTVRKTRGHDIAAACGQLVGKVIDRTQRQEKFNIKVQNKNALMQAPEVQTCS